MSAKTYAWWTAETAVFTSAGLKVFVGSNTQLFQCHHKFQSSYLLQCDGDLIPLWYGEPIRCWLGSEMYSSPRTSRLAVVVLNSLLTGLFPIPCTSCCLERTWLAASLHAWPQLRAWVLHGWVECPDPCGATVHPWKRVTDRCRGTPSCWVRRNHPWYTLKTRPRCWSRPFGTSWLQLFPLPCWVNHSGICLPTSASEEHNKIIWTHTLSVPHSFRHTDMSSGFHLF